MNNERNARTPLPFLPNALADASLYVFQYNSTGSFWLLTILLSPFFFLRLLSSLHENCTSAYSSPLVKGRTVFFSFLQPLFHFPSLLSLFSSKLGIMPPKNSSRVSRASLRPKVVVATRAQHAPPSSSKRSEGGKAQSLYAVIAEELDVLGKILENGDRPSVFRHHHFFSTAKLLRRRATKAIAPPLTAASMKKRHLDQRKNGRVQTVLKKVMGSAGIGSVPGELRTSPVVATENEENRSRIGHVILDDIDMCALAAVSELSAMRINTIPVSLAILGVCARLHWCFSSALSPQGICEDQPLHERLRTVTTETTSGSNSRNEGSSSAKRRGTWTIGGTIEAALTALPSK